MWPPGSFSCRLNAILLELSSFGAQLRMESQSGSSEILSDNARQGQAIAVNIVFLALVEVNRNLIIIDFGAASEAATAKQIKRRRILIGDFHNEVTDALAAEIGKGKSKQLLSDAPPAVLWMHDQMIYAPAIMRPSGRID